MVIWLSIARLTAIILRGSTRVRIKSQVDMICCNISLLTWILSKFHMTKISMKFINGP